MKQYNINKGIGRTVEFKGLKAQYLFLFAGGLLSILLLTMILYLAGTNSYLCLIAGGGGAAGIVWQTFSFNSKYGEHGLMKAAARARHPRYIICRQSVRNCLKAGIKSKAT